MRGRKRQRKKTCTLFVGQPRRRQRERIEMDRAIAEMDAAVRAALRSGFTFDPRPEQIPPHFTIWGQR